MGSGYFVQPRFNDLADLALCTSGLMFGLCLQKFKVGVGIVLARHMECLGISDLALPACTFAHKILLSFLQRGRSSQGTVYF